MMREIKFRVWHKADKKMYEVYGFSQNKWFLRGKNFPMPLGAIELMQYTGLKDKNGKEIYEGDIVIAWSEGQKAICEIKWGQGRVGFFLYRSPYIIWNLSGGGFDYTNETVEVIGNIYEHEHLLKR